MTQKRLFLLDAYALIFRGYYAFIKNPRINSKGLDTSAILGFMNALMDVIRSEKPDHLAVAFDKGGSDLRAQLFPEYKANRDETPEAIKIAVPYIQALLKAMHIPIVEVPGFEADDLIGTLAKQAEKQGYRVYMVTPDKDFGQLVSDNIFMYRPARSGNEVEIWGVDEVKAKFEVQDPLQVIDFLGMMGDAVDNIPGLPGVGEKTAKKLLAEFGSMENLLANTHQLKGALKEKIEANKALGILSKQLATILLDCPVTFDETAYELVPPDVEQTDALFQELEFRQLKTQFDKLYGGSGGAAPTASSSSATKAQPPASASDQFDLFGFYDPATATETPTFKSYHTLADTEHLYQLAATPMAHKLLAQSLMQQSAVCFDTETTGLDALQAELVGIAFSWEKGKGYYVPLPDTRDEVLAILQQFVPFFEAEHIAKIGQNLKYDLKILAQYGLSVRGPLHDTMIAHYLINPDMRHNMDVLSETYLHYSPQSIESLIGKKGKGQLNMREVAVEAVKEYAAEDADITWQLHGHFTPILEKVGMQNLYSHIEMPLVPVLASMERHGIQVDRAFLAQMSADMAIEIQALEQSIYDQAGEVFNLASPKQLGDVLFDRLKIGGSKQKKTKTGQYATGEEILSGLVKAHPIVPAILEWRQLVKLQSTYVDALPQQINPRTGRIHTDYMQTVAATGRLSSNNPNLQNIPIRTPRGQQIRKAFIPCDDQHVLLSADYSQIELRIIAALSGEDAMMEAFRQGEDIHRSTAAKVFGIAPEAVTKEQRSQAKTVNFGIIYGVSAFGLSNQTTLSRSESAELIDTYYKTYPKLRSFMQQQVDFAREHGYVQTIMGRRRYLKDINSANAVVRGAAERNAINAPIQGSAADIIKQAMIGVYQAFEQAQLRSKMLLQVHDELVFEVAIDELETVKTIVKAHMEGACQLAVPLEVEMGWGQNWLEAH